jgi:hypothetical protein
MATVLALWAFTLAACSLIGEALCRLAGLRPWSWLAGPIGMCALVVIGAGAASVPGRGTTGFVLIAGLAAGAAGWIAWSDRAGLASLARRALDPAFTALVVLAATLIPFVANGRVGLLGPSFNNDSRWHLWAAEYFRAGRTPPSSVLGGGYPVGPHSLVGALAAGTGTGVEAGFVALLMVIAVLTAFAARAALQDLPRPRATLVALLTALGYLLASYYAQAGHKETLQALIVLTFALVLRELIAQERLGPRAAPLPALLIAATVLNYSYPGLAWLGGTLVLGAAGLLVVHRRSLTRAGALKAVRGALPALGVLAVILLVALAPQADRIVEFFDQLSLSPKGAGVITTADVGNLVHPISPYEGLGIWLAEDFRFSPTSGFHAGLLGAVALAAAIFGLVWWLRRREVLVLAAAATSVLLYVVLRDRESAYLAAKALVILSPFPVLLGLSALLARYPPLPAELQVVRVVVAGVLICGAAYSSLLALRNAQVNPAAHERELQGLRPLFAGRDVLFLGYDDYIGWRLFGATVTNPQIQDPVDYVLRKPFTDGSSLDFDSVTPRTLNRYDFVVTTRTAYASLPPANFERVRTTRSYEIYRRHGRTPDSKLLGEGDAPGGTLDCEHSPRDRRLARSRGALALVRPAPVAVQGPPGMGAGITVGAQIALPSAGRWELSIQYASPQILTVSTATGQGWSLPPNLDRLGPYWRVGEVTTQRSTTLRLALHLQRAAPAFLTADSQYSPLGKIAAVRVDRPPRWVPVRQACGRYVDRYRPARPAATALRARSAAPPASRP